MNDIDIRPKALSGFGEVIRLSLPTSLTMLNVTLLRFVDGLMVSRVGPEAFSAQHVAGMTAFIIEALGFGTLAVLNTFVSQSLGQRKFARGARYTWAGFHLALGFALLCQPLLLLARPLFGLYGHGQVILELEVVYFRYMILGIFLTSPSRALQQFFYGIHRPGVVLLSALTANLFNVGANYVLIFGKLGFPAMGLEGAAIGSLVSWGLQLTILLGVYLSGRINEQFLTRRPWVFHPTLYRRLIAIGWPAGVQFFNSMLCWNLFTNYLVASFGAAHLAANSVAMRYGLVIILPIVGIGVATTALVGRYIGAGRPDLARQRTHAALTVALLYLITVGSGILIFRRPMVRLFTKEPASVSVSRDAAPSETASPPAAAQAESAAASPQPERIVRIGAVLLLCLLAFQTFDAVSIIYNGALRGAGDTRWPMLVETPLAWAIEVGGGCLMVHFLPQLEGLGPYLAATAYLLLLGVLFAWRFEHGPWQEINLFGKRGRRLRPRRIGSPAPDAPADANGAPDGP